MKNYYVQNGKININKYCVEYTYTNDNSNSTTTTEVEQYLKNDDELNALTDELTKRNEKYKVTLLNTENLTEFDGVAVNSYEEARKLIEPTLEEVKASKIKEISDLCENKIYKGIDIVLDGVSKHFSLKIEDQLNLNRLALIYQNADDDAKIIYHADGEVYSEYSKQQFFEIVSKSSEFISSQTQYCNKLMKHIEELVDIGEVKEIEYGV